jgi:hypothetical protein
MLRTHADESTFRISASICGLYIHAWPQFLYRLDLLELRDRTATGDQRRLRWQRARSRRSRTSKSRTHVGGGRGWVILIGAEVTGLEGWESRGPVRYREVNKSVTAD